MGKLKETLAELDKELSYSLKAVRGNLVGNGLVLMSGLGLEPIYLEFDYIPKAIADRLVMLKMLDKYEKIPKVGKRIDDTNFYVYVTVKEWRELSQEALATKKKENYE